jgi:hypothetical protein
MKKSSKSWSDRVEGIRSEFKVNLRPNTEVEIRATELDITENDDLGSDKQWHTFEICITDPDTKLGSTIKLDSLSPDDAREIARQLKLQANRVEAREKKNIRNGNAHLNHFNIPATWDDELQKYVRTNGRGERLEEQA